MLVLTHGYPASEAQRRVFGMLHRMGLGVRQRRGVVVIGDGFERFGPVAGLICTPEAIAVLAVRAVSGADGYLFAPSRGGWTIGGRPALVDGGGTNPIPEVDRALKQIVATVRGGGLDPGYLQSLIVADGPVTGVAQPETERGAGVVVAPATTEGIIEAIDLATVNREPGLTGSWTTADLTRLLGLLGFDCSGLDTALLTGEGFPYSPYALRLTPAADQRPTGPIPAVTPAVERAAVLEPAEPAGPASLLRAPDDELEPRRSPWRWLVPLLVLAAVVAGVWFGWGTLFAGRSDGARDTGSPTTPSATTAAAPAPAHDQQAGGYAFSEQATDQVTECSAHAYGQIQQYLAAHPCTSMSRGLYLTTVEGKQVVVAIAEVTMPDADAAAGLKTKADTDGTGNVNDLLREGNVPAGLPGKEVLKNSEYASSIDQTVVRIAQAAFVDGSPTTPGVDAAADAALELSLG